MKLKKNVKKEWVKALRSGEYRQGKGWLYRDESFCCLGVLCDLSPLDINNVRYSDTSEYLDDQRMSIPPLEVLKWAFTGANDTSDIFKMKVNIKNYKASLTTHNDQGISFKTLADAIEEQL